MGLILIGLFNWSLIDWNVIVDDDMIINTYVIGENIFLTLDSGSIWCVDIGTGKVVSIADSEMRDIKSSGMMMLKK